MLLSTFFFIFNAYAADASFVKLTRADQLYLVNSILDNLRNNSNYISIPHDDKILVILDIKNKSNEDIDLYSLHSIIKKLMLDKNLFAVVNTNLENESYFSKYSLLDSNKALQIGKFFGANYALNAYITTNKLKKNKIVYNMHFEVINIRTSATLFLDNSSIVKQISFSKYKLNLKTLNEIQQKALAELIIFFIKLYQSS